MKIEKARDEIDPLDEIFVKRLGSGEMFDNELKRRIKIIKRKYKNRIIGGTWDGIKERILEEK